MGFFPEARVIGFEWWMIPLWVVLAILVALAVLANLKYTRRK